MFFYNRKNIEKLQTLKKQFKSFEAKNVKEASDKSLFSAQPNQILGHKIERTTITLLKSRINAIMKIQPL